MIQAPEYTAGDSCQPQFSHPRLVVEPHRGAPLMSAPGLGIVHGLVERLGVASVIDDRVCVLRRHKWYTESDYALTLTYNMLSGGDTLSDVNRLRGDAGLHRLLGNARIPHASTVGDFLARFDGKREGSSKRDQQAGKVALIELREAIEEIQQRAFGLLSRARRGVATLDWDSSIHVVRGEQKEGADFSYDKRWSYSALYGTVAETGDVVHLGLHEGNRHTSYGLTEVLPGTIERVQEHFRKVRMRADSGYYDQKIVSICDERGVEFYIVAKPLRNLLKAVHGLAESAWRPLPPEGELTGRRRRQRRENVKRKISRERKRDQWTKGRPEVATLKFRPTSWQKGYRYVIKRTPVLDAEGGQKYLDDGMREYRYWIVVTNSKRSNRAVLRIAQGRGNQENLIKDLKHGLGLSHVPTGLLGANQAYFMIAGLAWNLKTWMLNLLELGDGAVLRCKRFFYLWIWQAGVVAKSGRNSVVLKMSAGEYFQRYSAAHARLAKL